MCIHSFFKRNGVLGGDQEIPRGLDTIIKKNEMIKKMEGKSWKSAPYDDKLSIKHETYHMEQSDLVIMVERL